VDLEAFLCGPLEAYSRHKDGTFLEGRRGYEVNKYQTLLDVENCERIFKGSHSSFGVELGIPLHQINTSLESYAWRGRSDMIYVFNAYTF
jgi:hypothetical protein